MDWKWVGVARAHASSVAYRLFPVLHYSSPRLWPTVLTDRKSVHATLLSAMARVLKSSLVSLSVGPPFHLVGGGQRDRKKPVRVNRFCVPIFGYQKVVPAGPFSIPAHVSGRGPARETVFGTHFWGREIGQKGVPRWSPSGRTFEATFGFENLHISGARVGHISARVGGAS